jgi:3-methylfumaryl-CoA hydratase
MHVRLYAGGDIQYHDKSFPSLGSRVTRTTTYHSAPILKQSRNGPVIFVSLSHEYRYDHDKSTDASRLTDIQFFAYRSSLVPRVITPNTRVEDNDEKESSILDKHRWSRPFIPLDEVLLFRYSALTFNSHRIHYVRIHNTCTVRVVPWPYIDKLRPCTCTQMDRIIHTVKTKVMTVL